MKLYLVVVLIVLSFGGLTALGEAWEQASPIEEDCYTDRDGRPVCIKSDSEIARTTILMSIFLAILFGLGLHKVGEW